MRVCHTLRRVWEVQYIGGEGARRAKGMDLRTRTSHTFAWWLTVIYLWMSNMCCFSLPFLPVHISHCGGRFCKTKLPVIFSLISYSPEVKVDLLWPFTVLIHLLPFEGQDKGWEWDDVRWGWCHLSCFSAVFLSAQWITLPSPLQAALAAPKKKQKT